jgi:uncharacterized membrane protein
MTDGQLTADPDGMLTLPGVFARTVGLEQRFGAEGVVWPVSLDGQPGFSGYANLFDGPGPPGPVSVASSVRNYGPVGYLPQAAGVALGRLVGASPLSCFYLARLANLVVAIGLLFLAIRLAPFGKQIFLLLALLPMTMFELASVSCDALTIAGAMLFTALLLWASTRERLRGIEIAAILAAAAVLLDVKPGYWALVLLVLLLTPGQVGGRKAYVAFVAASVVLVVGVTVVVARLTSADSLTVANGGSRLPFIVGQPLDFLGILWSHLPENLSRGLIQGIGILGWLDIPLPPVFYAFVLAAAAAFFLVLGEEVHLALRRRVLLATVGVLTFLAIMASLYAFLKPSADILLQGRYLVPVWLLLLLSAYGTRFASRHRGLPVVAGVAVLMMAVSLQTLMSAYHP